MEKPGRSSSSLFTSEHSKDSLKKIQDAQQKDKKRRLKLFKRVGIPLCILGVLLIAFLLRDPIRSLFQKDYIVKKYFDEYQAQNKISADVPEAPVSNEFGRAGSPLWVELKNPEMARINDGLLDAIMDAVDTKPSEIFYINKKSSLENSVDERDRYLKINDKEEYEVLKNGVKTKIKLSPDMSAEDLIAVLNFVYLQVYSSNSLHPLQLKLSDEFIKEQKMLKKRFLPVFVTSEKDVQDDSQIVLPLPHAVIKNEAIKNP
ncbi:MAG: hypothetical protein WCS73_12630 [Lentisphaeria bacterium]